MVEDNIFRDLVCSLWLAHVYTTTPLGLEKLSGACEGDNGR
jgi:hypothetical protein